MDYDHYSPMPLFHCVGETMAWWLICLCALTPVLYLTITFLFFIPAAKAARSLTERMIWICFALIFPSCGVAGYLTVSLSGWYPEAAYMLKLAAVFANNFFASLVCIVGFFHKSFGCSDTELKQRIRLAIELAQSEEDALRQVGRLVEAENVSFITED